MSWIDYILLVIILIASVYTKWNIIVDFGHSHVDLKRKFKKVDKKLDNVLGLIHLSTPQRFKILMRESIDNDELGLSPDDCVEIFLNILPGQDDITKELLEQLCANYDTTLEEVLKD